jgi:hypothetical protein
MRPVCVRSWAAVIVVIGSGGPFSPYSSPVSTRKPPHQRLTGRGAPIDDPGGLTAAGAALSKAAQGEIQRLSARADSSPSPPAAPVQSPTPGPCLTMPDGSSRGKPGAVRAARRVRRAAWGNGPAATPTPRPRPTQPPCGLTGRELPHGLGDPGLGCSALGSVGGSGARGVVPRSVQEHPAGARPDAWQADARPAGRLGRPRWWLLGVRPAAELLAGGPTREGTGWPTASRSAGAAGVGGPSG